ncbi:hypothetical protein ACIQ9P_25550 [Kitasatospora sp. NPDC094019]|uniref:hypothetical protein n=1 Tax=Kitasatospora sp. NPDC094019 TaxID=3364091 RepID=UPI00382638B1
MPSSRLPLRTATALAAGLTALTLAAAPVHAQTAPAPEPGATVIDHHDKGGAGQGPITPFKGQVAGAPSALAASVQITRSEAIARANGWVGKGLDYSWTGSYQGYRTDCSGYVSMGWKLATPGLDTTSFVPSGVASWIGKGDLKPGDALLNDAAGANGHVVMFDHWTDSSQSSYVGYEFTGSGVHHRTIPYPYFSGLGTYRPVRNNSIVDDVVRRPSLVGVYHQANQTFYEGNNAGGTLGSAKYGNPGWMPLAGDWNGDKVSSVGAYDPTTGKFYLSNDNGTTATTVTFGNPGWIPLAGDWNGDGRDTIGAYDPTTSTFYLTNDNTNTAVNVTYGSPGDKPLVGDWSNSGRDSIGVYHPDTQTYYEGTITGTTLGSAKYGNPNWTPVTGDWNADGTTSIGAYDPTTSTFYLTNDNGTTANSFVYGSPGDLPITGAW